MELATHFLGSKWFEIKKTNNWLLPEIPTDSFDFQGSAVTQ